MRENFWVLNYVRRGLQLTPFTWKSWSFKCVNNDCGKLHLYPCLSPSQTFWDYGLKLARKQLIGNQPPINKHTSSISLAWHLYPTALSSHVFPTDFDPLEDVNSAFSFLAPNIQSTAWHTTNICWMSIAKIIEIANTHWGLAVLNIWPASSHLISFLIHTAVFLEGCYFHGFADEETKAKKD